MRSFATTAAVALLSIPISLHTGCTSNSHARRDAGGKMPPGDAAGGSSGAGTPAAASVLEHHNHPSRDGVYVDAALTKTAAGRLRIDPSFAGANVRGPTYAQPLYLAGKSGQPDLVIVATEQNVVSAFDAASGKKIWERTLGTPVPRSQLPCGNIDPLGVTGTPIIDGDARTLFLDAMVQQGGAPHHQVFSLDANTGAVRSGWPVDLNATVSLGTTKFDSAVQNQRGALALLAGSVFVPFGGHFGDCGSYHGVIVGIPVNDPKSIRVWATRAIAGGIWAPGGVASDGTSIYFATGNTESQPNDFSAPATWQDGNALFRLSPDLKNANYFATSDWQELDDSDRDLGGSNPIVFDVVGATPEHLAIALGKDGKAYLVDRANMGGIGAPLASAVVSPSAIINAPAQYSTETGVYVVFKGAGQGCPEGEHGGLTAIRISRTAPPAIAVAWCAGPSTQASPAVSMTDANGSNALVWIVGNDDKLYALDGDTGASVFDGGASAMSTVQKFQTPIVANGRVFVAANDRVYAFTP
jgi:outer membrane protein assembly factor BamB